MVSETKTVSENSSAPASVSPAQEVMNVPDSEQILSDPGWVQTKLTVGAVDDPMEREAEYMANQVMRMPEPHFIQRKCAHCAEEEKIHRKSLPPFIQRKCSHCEEEQLHRKPLIENISPFVQRKHSDSTTVSDSVAHGIEETKGGGQMIDDTTRSFMESRFEADFSNVRVHNSEYSAHLSSNLNAQAFTVGNDIYFNQGKYAPSEERGKHLLAHELTHTLQQGGLNRMIQRTIHGGSSPVPTNCHNWTIPLPPWIAGTFAHSQIAAFFAAMGATPRMMPRAIKILPCTSDLIPRPFGTPPGFADLWVRKPTSVEVAEIKSTNTGDACARNEASHYRNRHNDWFARSTTLPLALDDTLYSRFVGPPVPGGILDLSFITGTDLPLGPFIADPGKMLHVEADAMGAVVYWCTGLGIINPVWLLVLRALLDRLRRMMEEMRRQWDRLQPVLEQIAQVAFTILKWLIIILLAIALIALVVVIIICAIAEIPTAGLATLCEVPAIAAAAAVVAAIVGVFGLPEAALAAAILGFFGARQMNSAGSGSESDYDRDNGPGAMSGSAGGGIGNASVTHSGDRLAAALTNITSSVSLGNVSEIADSFSEIPARAPFILTRAAAALEQNGDVSTAEFIRSGKHALGYV